MNKILELVKDYLGEDVSDNALKLMTNLKTELDAYEAPKSNDEEWQAKLDAMTKERDDAFEREKKVRADYMAAFFNPQPGAKETPTTTEAMTPGINLSVNDWLLGN